MNTEKCFEIFKQYKTCFDVDTSDLNYLKSLDANEMINDDNLIYVTPMLNKIASYALTYKYIDIDYIKDLGVKNIRFYDQISELSLACCDYINILYDEGCIHPSILRSVYLDEGVATYENLLDFLIDIRDKLYKSKNAKIFDNFGNNTIQKTTDLDEKYQNEMIKELNSIVDFKNFNKRASDYAFLYTMRKLLLADRNDMITYSYNYDYQFGRIVRKSGSELLMAFTDFMINLNKIKEENEEIECEEDIEYVLEYYKLYNSYQNYYIKSACSENKILSFIKQCK